MCLRGRPFFVKTWNLIELNEEVSHGKILEEMMVGLCPERREWIEKRTAELIAEEDAQRERRSRQARTKTPAHSNSLPQTPVNGKPATFLVHGS